MSLNLTLNRAEHIRTAPCQRCGWTSSLHHAHRHDRGSRPATTYRWLCAECAAELGHPAGSVNVPDMPLGSTAPMRHPIGARS
jgi:hypothetical protein